MTLATVAAAITAGACSNGPDTEEFARGRDTATVWLTSPTPFSEDDGQVQLDLIADTFNWPHRTPFENTYLTGPIEGTGWNTRGYNNPDVGGGIDISNLDHTWSYATANYFDDTYCRECTPLPFNKEEAQTRTEQKLQQLGLDPATFRFRDRQSGDDQGRTTSITISADLIVGNTPTDLTWSFSYRNADGEIDSAIGHFVTVTELGDVPILTPAEALTLAGRQPTPDAINNAELTLETQYNRETNQRILIPVYAIPVSNNLNIPITITATRPQDIPKPPNPPDQ